jgi:hypothetical protein
MYGHVYIQLRPPQIVNNKRRTDKPPRQSEKTYFCRFHCRCVYVWLVEFRFGYDEARDVSIVGDRS